MSELVCRTLKLLAENKDGFASAVKNIFNTRTMATLKISDLSVGDWVHHDFYEVDMRVVTIYGDNERVIAESSSGHGVTCHLDHFTPIPITAEMLEANGWRVIEKEALGYEYEYDGEERVWDDYSIGICETRPGVFWYSWRSEYYMWRLEYVHQLQHLIRLAGVDREIVMPKK